MAKIKPSAMNGHQSGRLTAKIPAIKHQFRRTLLHLADCVDAVVSDADTAAGAAVEAGAGLPEEVWEVGTGVLTGIALYRHAVRVMAVRVLSRACLESHEPGDLIAAGTAAAPARIARAA